MRENMSLVPFLSSRSIIPQLAVIHRLESSARAKASCDAWKK